MSDLQEQYHTPLRVLATAGEVITPGVLRGTVEWKTLNVVDSMAGA